MPAITVLLFIAVSSFEARKRLRGKWFLPRSMRPREERVFNAQRYRRGQRAMMQSKLLRRYGFAWVTGGFFVISLIGHWLFGGFAYVNDQRDKGRPASLPATLSRCPAIRLKTGSPHFCSCSGRWRDWPCCCMSEIAPQSKEGDDRLWSWPLRPRPAKRRSRRSTMPTRAGTPTRNTSTGSQRRCGPDSCLSAAINPQRSILCFLLIFRRVSRACGGAAGSSAISPQFRCSPWSVRVGNSLWLMTA